MSTEPPAPPIGTAAIFWSLGCIVRRHSSIGTVTGPLRIRTHVSLRFVATKDILSFMCHKRYVVFVENNTFKKKVRVVNTGVKKLTHSPNLGWAFNTTNKKITGYSSTEHPFCIPGSSVYGTRKTGIMPAGLYNYVVGGCYRLLATLQDTW